MGRITRTVDDAVLAQRTESRLRELDRRVTTVLTQDTTWPRGLIGFATSTTSKYPITGITNLLGVTVTLQAGRTYRFESQFGVYVNSASRGLIAARVAVGGTVVGKTSQVVEPNGWVEVADIVKTYIPVATAISTEVLLSIEPDLGLTYGVHAAGDYPLWLTVTDTGPATSVTGTATIY